MFVLNDFSKVHTGARDTSRAANTQRARQYFGLDGNEDGQIVGTVVGQSIA